MPRRLDDSIECRDCAIHRSTISSASFASDIADEEVFPVLAVNDLFVSGYVTESYVGCLARP